MPTIHPMRRVIRSRSSSKKRSGPFSRRSTAVVIGR